MNDIADDMLKTQQRLEETARKGFDAVVERLDKAAQRDEQEKEQAEPEKPKEPKKEPQHKYDLGKFKQFADLVKNLTRGGLDLGKLVKPLTDFGKTVATMLPNDVRKGMVSAAQGMLAGQTAAASAAAPQEQQEGQQEKPRQTNSVMSHLQDAGRSMVNAARLFGKNFGKTFAGLGEAGEAGEAAAGIGSVGAGAATAAGGVAQAGASAAAGGATAGAGGAAGAGAGTAGAGAAAAGGVAALASNPVGWVIGIAVAAGAAIVGLVSLSMAVAKLGDSVMEANRKFGEYSAAMAQVMAKYDVAKIFSNKRIGDKTAKSADFLAEGQIQMTKTLEPFREAWANLSNLFTGVLVRLANKFLSLFEPFIKMFNQFLEWFQKWLDWLIGLDKKEENKDVPAVLPWLQNIAGIGGRTLPKMPAFPPRPMGRPFPIAAAP